MIVTKNLPWAPAYLVFHDAFDNGAMDVWPAENFEIACQVASQRNSRLEETGEDECGVWRAYVNLPRVKTWRYNAPKQVSQ